MPQSAAPNSTYAGTSVGRSSSSSASPSFVRSVRRRPVSSGTSIPALRRRAAVGAYSAPFGTAMTSRSAIALRNRDFLYLGVTREEDAGDRFVPRIGNQGFAVEFAHVEAHAQSFSPFTRGDGVATAHEHVHLVAGPFVLTPALERKQDAFDADHPPYGRHVVSETRQQGVVPAPSAQ